MTGSSIKKLLHEDAWPNWARLCWHYLSIFIKDIVRSDLTTQASAMAYTTLFSLIPSLAVLFTLMGLFLPFLGDHGNLIEMAKQFVFKNLATGSGTQVVQYLESFLAGLDLKKIGMSMFVGLLVTLILLLHQIEQALNRIWLVTKARPVFTRFVYFWLFLTLGLFGLAVVFGISAKYGITTLITKQTLAAVDKADNIPIVSMLISWLSSCVIFFFVYKVVPNCSVSPKSALRGALLAGTLFYTLGKIYTVYVSSIANYKSIYGTLAALPVFLMWIYVCWVIVLLGALYAWRVQAGFPTIEESTTIETAKTPTEHLRNYKIQSGLPLVTLVVIHAKFTGGQGEGVSLSDLVKMMHLPHSWVHDSIEALFDLGLIVQGKLSSNKFDSDEDRWFPASPANQVALDDFRHKINAPLSEWLATWSADLHADIQKILTASDNSLKGKTIADIMP